MSKSRKSFTISDQISEILKPKQLTEEETTNVEARVEEFNENLDEVISNRLSEIRKQTAKNLGELDEKYKGKAVSRKELELDVDEAASSSDGASEEENRNYATDSDEETGNSEEEAEENSGESEGESESDDEDDLDEDNFDISQFSKPQQTADSPINQEKAELLKNVSLNEEIKKGISVQNQLKLWEKLLEVRIKSQKMLISANGLPDFDMHLELTEDPSFSQKIEKTCDGIHKLMDNLLELQGTLVKKFPESKDTFASVKRKKEQNGSSGFLKKSKLVEYSEKIEENHSSYTSYRNQVLQKWHERTKSVKDTKNPAANLSIMAKIENSLLGKSEVIRRSQIYRGDYEVYGVEKTASDVQLPEIFDDSEFYHQLLRELIEYKSNIGENQAGITQKFIELQKVRSKMKKKVDTRASKGRKIRYVVHNKLVNFMPPRDNCDYTDEARSELFSSLFGMANQSEKL